MELLSLSPGEFQHSLERDFANGCGNANHPKEGVRSSVAGHSDATPVFKPAKHDLDAPAGCVEVLVIADMPTCPARFDSTECKSVRLLGLKGYARFVASERVGGFFEGE